MAIDPGKRAHRLSPFRYAGLITGVLLVGYSAWGLQAWWRATHAHGAVISKNLPTTQSTTHPDETPVNTASAYTVPADMPRSIILPTIQTNGFIQQVGTDQHNAVAVPGNVHVAGWYTHSVRPGDAGLSIIDGHVQGIYAEGIFKHLGSLKPNDTFQIEFGDHTRKTFIVRGVHSYNTEDAAQHLFELAPGISRQLNLITCGGSYNRVAEQYDQRIIIVAELLS